MKIKKEKFFILSLLWSLIVSILFYLVFYSVLSNKIDNLIKQAANTIYNFGIYLSVIIVFSTFIIGFILHELIHAVFCILFTKNHYQPTKFKNSKKKLCIPLFKGYFFVFGKPTSPFFNQKDQVEGKAIYFCAFV